MAVPSDLVGLRAGPFDHDVTPRWTMAYASVVGAADVAELMDSRRVDGLIAHPLFPVCLEWPAILVLGDLAGDAMSKNEISRGVHATHDLRVHRPIRPPETLHTTIEVIGVQRKTPGALMTVRLKTIGSTGEPVATTDQGLLYLGVDVEGPDCPPSDLPAPPPADGEALEASHQAVATIEAGEAHRYTECSRIYNPIHTDRAVAEKAGLPDIILHGTATLARSVSWVSSVANASPSAVRRVRARFAGMVVMPSQIELRCADPTPVGTETEDRTTVRFEAVDHAGTAILASASLELAG